MSYEITDKHALELVDARLKRLYERVDGLYKDGSISSGVAGIILHDLINSKVFVAQHLKIVYGATNG